MWGIYPRNFRVLHIKSVYDIVCLQQVYSIYKKLLGVKFSWVLSQTSINPCTKRIVLDIDMGSLLVILFKPDSLRFYLLQYLSWKQNPVYSYKQIKFISSYLGFTYLVFEIKFLNSFFKYVLFLIIRIYFLY